MTRTVEQELRAQLMDLGLKRNLQYAEHASISEIVEYIETMYTQDSNKDKVRAWIEDTLDNYPGYLIEIKSQPPPTPLNTLHRMHERCLQLEEDIAEIKLMGGLEDYEGELETDIQTLTFSINNIIEEIEEIES